MNLTAELDAVLQIIGALITFVADFLTIATFVVICLLSIELIFEHANLIRDYGARPVSLRVRALSQPSMKLREVQHHHPV